ncbi:hypothetical protein ACR9E3_31250 [Actinomycetospora sp. C-140]
MPDGRKLWNCERPLLNGGQSVLACRDALTANVKPEIAIDALVTALRAG